MTTTNPEMRVLGYFSTRPLARKAVTNLDSVLKSRDITFPTKVHTVKPVFFPVVISRCEGWTIKKAEHHRIMLSNYGAGEDS